MTNAVEEWTEEERAEKIAEALTALGLNASAEDTGGGIICVVIPRTDSGFISWGTADVTWGAVITNADGEQVSSISTDWPSDSEDVAATAKALLHASLRNGAAQTGA
jgi:hypothetical protein